MNATPSSSPRPSATSPSGQRRALVLGGGGSTGNAWLIGVVAGLFDAGVDVTTADLTVGTSAGSTAAAQLAGASPTELLAGVLTSPTQRTGPAGPVRFQAPATSHNPGTPVPNHLSRVTQIIASAADPADMRRKVGAGALALDAASDGTWSARWRATVATRLPRQNWPHHTMLITAVDAGTGEPVVFDRHSGVDLVDAVAASCSSSLPYRIGDGRYIDGGYRRNENADLAAGRERVLVLSPFGGRTLHPLGWGMQLAAQIAELRAAGSYVEAIFPDSNSEHLFGGNAMDLSLRPAAAQAGYDRGGALAEQLSGFWH
jgi:NTE family protein